MCPKNIIVFFYLTGKWRRPPRSAGTRVVYQPAAVATRLFCISLVREHFSGEVGTLIL